MRAESASKIKVQLPLSNAPITAAMPNMKPAGGQTFPAPALAGQYKNMIAQGLETNQQAPATTMHMIYNKHPQQQHSQQRHIQQQLKPDQQNHQHQQQYLQHQHSHQPHPQGQHLRHPQQSTGTTQSAEAAKAVLKTMTPEQQARMFMMFQQQQAQQEAQLQAQQLAQRQAQQQALANQYIQQQQLQQQHLLIQQMQQQTQDQKHREQQHHQREQHTRLHQQQQQQQTVLHSAASTTRGVTKKSRITDTDGTQGPRRLSGAGKATVLSSMGIPINSIAQSSPTSHLVDASPSATSPEVSQRSKEHTHFLPLCHGGIPSAVAPAPLARFDTIGTFSSGESLQPTRYDSFGGSPATLAPPQHKKSKTSLHKQQLDLHNDLWKAQQTETNELQMQEQGSGQMYCGGVRDGEHQSNAGRHGTGQRAGSKPPQQQINGGDKNLRKRLSNDDLERWNRVKTMFAKSGEQTALHHEAISTSVTPTASQSKALAPLDTTVSDSIETPAKTTLDRNSSMMSTLSGLSGIMSVGDLAKGDASLVMTDMIRGASLAMSEMSLNLEPGVSKLEDGLDPAAHSDGSLVGEDDDHDEDSFSHLRQAAVPAADPRLPPGAPLELPSRLFSRAAQNDAPKNIQSAGASMNESNQLESVSVLQKGTGFANQKFAAV